MAYKSIVTILSDPGEVASVLDQVAPFAAATGAHLDVLCLGIDRTQTGYYFAGATALMHDETLTFARTEAAEIEQKARDALDMLDLSWGLEALVTQSASVATLVASRARYCDLVMLPKPYGADLPADAPVIVEAAMFQGRCPVIVLAADMAPSAKPGKVVIAWNESTEAMAAIRRAMPLLIAADEVNICIVNPDRHAPDAADPGAELSKMLTRHGAKVEVSILPQTLTRVSEVIARHVADQNADLLVMGAYGHSRFREAILGGATRNMLEHCSIPVFMAH
ncbi:MAG: universal stress protein [Pseudomonadota bacterium]